MSTNPKKTTPLYYRDPPPLSFTARVVATPAPDQLILDQTAFYPEGGGQPSDVGEIEGVHVTGARKTDGVITHHLGEAVKFSVGQEISGAVDPAHRRDYQQQHTGQHVLSATLYRHGLNTVSVHQGEEYTTIEVDAAEIDPALINQIEVEANQVIEQDLRITSTMVPEDEIDHFPLRRPPKVSGVIRVIQVGDHDCVACGGVHLSRTGQVRLIRTLSTESIRGNTRIAYKIGDRAVAHYALCSSVAADLASQLSAQIDELPTRVKKLTEQVTTLQAELTRATEKTASLLAADLIEKARSAVESSTEKPLCIAAGLGNYDAAFVRSVMEKLIVAERVAACLTAVQPENKDNTKRLVWSIGVSPGVEFDFAGHRSELMELIDGKGGGRPPIWQGIGQEMQGEEKLHRRFLGLHE